MPPRLLGPAEEDLTFTEVRFSNPLKNVLNLPGSFRKRLFLTYSGFPLVLLRQLLAVLELADRFTLRVKELVGDRTRSRKVCFMPISLVKSDQLHLGFIQDSLIVDNQCFFALGNVAIFRVDAIREESHLLVLLKLNVHM